MILSAGLPLGATQLFWFGCTLEKVFVYFADRTLAVFDAPSDRLPVPSFAESFNLTVGQLFSWLEE
ncbi:MAG TPA: hypothetical protein V6C57_12460 [Coleofasciculaceae cyanobacterium]